MIPVGNRLDHGQAVRGGSDDDAFGSARLNIPPENDLKQAGCGQKFWTGELSLTESDP
jgi:hypothetical protein